MLGKARLIIASGWFLSLLAATGGAHAQEGGGGANTLPAVPAEGANLPVVEPPLPSFEGTTPASPVPTLTTPGIGPVPAEGVSPSPAAEPVGAATPAEAVAVPVDNPNALPATRRFQYAFRLGLSGVYDDNVNLRGRERGGAFYFTVEPGATVGYGDILGRSTNYVRLDYAPSLYLFTSQSEATALQHLIRAEGQYLFSRVTATLSQDVQILDGADLNVTSNTGTTVNRVNTDVAGRTRVNIYVTRAGFTFSLSDKSALALALLYNNNAYESLLSSQTTSADFSYNYTYSPKLTLGLAVAAGFLAAESPNPNQTFEQVNLRASYQGSGKLAFNGSFGLEVRQFENGGNNNVTPVLEFGLLYQPFDSMTLSLSANRRVLSSAAVAGSDYTSTGFVASVRQRFLRRFFASLTFGYENSSYFSTTSGGADASRQDDYFYLQPSLECRITENWSASIFYVHRQDTSSGTASRSFENNQVGLRTGYSF